MRLCLLALASTLVLALPLAAGAVGTPGETIRWEDFDDPAFDPVAPQPREAAAAPVVAGVAPYVMSDRARSISLGPVGVDEDGVEGRVHTVETGETLWDISDAYLGTPWVWPSVWTDNEAIANPHVIQPGDQIWISSTEMRRITSAEAEQLIGQAIDLDEEPMEEPVVAAYDGPPEEPLLEEPTLEELPSLEPVAGETMKVPPHQRASIVTEDVLDVAAEIADSPTVRVMLTQGDEAYLELGEGEVSVGDEFTIFRSVLDIRDPKTRAVLGHHIDELGWLKVTSIDGAWSTATIVEATDEIQRGDRIIPRERVEREVTVRMGDPEMIGHIAFTPGYREMAGSTDSVYINLGSLQGIELGTKLAVYSGAGAEIDLPGAVVAEMVVIKVEPEVCAAFVTGTKRELQVGDVVRGPTARGAQRTAYNPN